MGIFFAAAFFNWDKENIDDSEVGEYVFHSAYCAKMIQLVAICIYFKTRHVFIQLEQTQFVYVFSIEKQFDYICRGPQNDVVLEDPQHTGEWEKIIDKERITMWRRPISSYLYEYKGEKGSY